MMHLSSIASFLVEHDVHNCFLGGGKLSPNILMGVHIYVHMNYMSRRVGLDTKSHYINPVLTSEFRVQACNGFY